MVKMVENDKPKGFMGANPYNKRKEWDDEGKTGKEFVSADDSLAYVQEKKYAVMDKMEGKKEEEVVETKEEEVPTDPQPDPYKKVDWKKRHDDLKRYYDKRVNEWKAKEKELKDQVKTNQPKYTPPTSKEELEKFREENPDLFAVIETTAHFRAGEEIKELQEKIAEVEEKLGYTEAAKAYAELKMLVPDFEEVRASEDFHNWAEQQPQEIQDWVYKNSTNVELAAKAINMYKYDRNATSIQQKPPTPRPEEKAAEAISITTRQEEPGEQKKIWSRAEIAGLSDAQYEKYRDEIDLAFSEGRIQ